jgi:hypothetical protein
MKSYLRFRIGVVICITVLLIGVLSFRSVVTRADKAGNAAKSAEKAVAKAEELAERCRELKAANKQAQFELDDANQRVKEAAGTSEEGTRAKEQKKALQKAYEATGAANAKCGEAEEARQAADAAIKKAEELLKEKTDRGGNVKDDENLDEKLKGLKDRLPKKPEQANVAAPNSGKVTETRTGNGLHTINFDTLHGRILVYLPDDMRAGDTISGTVVTEPKGTRPEEKAKNQAKLDTYVLDLEGTKVSTNEPRFTWTPTTPLPSQPTRYQLRIYEVLGDQTASAGLVAEALITRLAIRLPLDNLPTMTPVTSNTGEVLSQFRMPDSTIFSIDVATEKATDYPLRQQGRPVEIFGPFDGNLSNTTLRYGPAKSTVQDFEKNTENVSGGFGLLRPLAESPRKIVFEFPTNVTGPMGIMVKERDNVATGTARNVGVNLSAPKTNLQRGEKTVVTIEVSGLAGILKDVPLQLDSKGVINMEGGNFQNLRIKPEEVGLDGRYKTNRTITGVQAGGFNVTATVIVDPFDLNLQDDTDPNRLFHFNSFTGDYIFACGGGSCRGGTGGTSSQPPTGSSAPPPPVTLTGTGKPAMKGCIITLSHNAPDRRVFARLDACTKSGDASVETTSPKANFNITDKNTADNTATSPPK